MQTNEDIINLGDPVKIAELMALLGVNNDDFKDTMRTKRIQEVMEFLKTHPDPKFFVYKAVGSKQVDRIDFVHEYIHFYTEKREAEQQKAVLDSKIAVYDRPDLTDSEKINLREMFDDKMMLDKRISNLNEQIQVYEK